MRTGASWTNVSESSPWGSNAGKNNLFPFKLSIDGVSLQLEKCICDQWHLHKMFKDTHTHSHMWDIYIHILYIHTYTCMHIHTHTVYIVLCMIWWFFYSIFLFWQVHYHVFEVNIYYDSPVLSFWVTVCLNLSVCLCASNLTLSSIVHRVNVLVR